MTKRQSVLAGAKKLTDAESLDWIYNAVSSLPWETPPTAEEWEELRGAVLAFSNPKDRDKAVREIVKRFDVLVDRVEDAANALGELQEILPS